MLQIFLPNVLLSLESRDQRDVPLYALLDHVLQHIRTWAYL